MQFLENGYRGLSLLWNLNWDLLLFVSMITFALVMGMYLGGAAG